MKYCSAWFEITGKVFVSQEELMGALKEKFPEVVRYDSENGEWHHTVSIEDEQETFREVAERKIDEIFHTDDPVKLNDVSIDLSSYSK